MTIPSTMAAALLTVHGACRRRCGARTDRSFVPENSQNVKQADEYVED